MTDGASHEISVSAAAQLLGTSGQTVRNYIRSGKLNARRAGKRSFMIERSSVETLMQQGVVREPRGVCKQGRQPHLRVSRLLLVSVTTSALRWSSFKRSS